MGFDKGLNTTGPQFERPGKQPAPAREVSAVALGIGGLAGAFAGAAGGAVLGMLGSVFGAIALGVFGAFSVPTLMRALEKSANDPRNRSLSFPDADCLIPNKKVACQRSTYEDSDQD